MNKFAFAILGVTLLLTGCANHVHIYRYTVKPNTPLPVLTVPPISSPVVHTSNHSYKQWQLQHSQNSQYEMAYVTRQWHTVKEHGERMALKCIQHTENILSTSNGQAQWVYVTGKGYQKKLPKLTAAPQCWGRIRHTFRTYKEDAENHTSPDNPLTAYDSAVIHWSNACMLSVVKYNSLTGCMHGKAIRHVQAAKQDVKNYMTQGDD